MFARRNWIPFLLMSVLFAVAPMSDANAFDETKSATGVDLITADELKAKLSSNELIIIIDVRGSESYANSSSRIKGAIHVNPRKLKYRLGFPPLKDVPKDRQVVTYCACPSDEASIDAAKKLLDNGFKTVRVLKGGWQEWQKAGGPVEPRPRG